MKDVYAIDTNLLLLLVVGTASPALIPLHKRTHAYTIDDYRLLERILSLADHVVLTPGVLTETSNLMRQSGHRRLNDIIDVYSDIVARTTEIYIAGRDAVQSPVFRRLGLTDAALLTLQSRDITLLTDDLDLYLASVSAGRKAINFSHERENWLRV